MQFMVVCFYSEKLRQTQRKQMKEKQTYGNHVKSGNHKTSTSYCSCQKTGPHMPPIFSVQIIYSENQLYHTIIELGSPQVG